MSTVEKDLSETKSTTTTVDTTNTDITTVTAKTDTLVNTKNIGEKFFVYNNNTDGYSKKTHKLQI